MSVALVLYAHGARDPRWAEPFERLRDMIAAREPETPVAIAYLEHARPDLLQLATELAATGVRRIKVVPLFFGRGGHLRDDLPRQLAEAGRRLPGVRFDVTMAAGEDTRVLEALATFAIEASPSSPPI